mmetsp:Transcript_53820/g.61667  ORF Transcript_53820/g.61667 Transcript_53820/m.61667 type:complete len:316 (+) Transcript_53820:835-1782(+)
MITGQRRGRESYFSWILIRPFADAMRRKLNTSDIAMQISFGLTEATASVLIPFILLDHVSLVVVLAVWSICCIQYISLGLGLLLPKLKALRSYYYLTIFKGLAVVATLIFLAVSVDLPIFLWPCLALYLIFQVLSFYYNIWCLIRKCRLNNRKRRSCQIMIDPNAHDLSVSTSYVETGSGSITTTEGQNFFQTPSPSTTPSNRIRRVIRSPHNGSDRRGSAEGSLNRSLFVVEEIRPDTRKIRAEKTVRRMESVIIETPDNDPSLQCVICLEFFVTNENVRVTLCQHSFHESCLKHWLLNHKNCPNCRAKITMIK